MAKRPKPNGRGRKERQLQVEDYRHEEARRKKNPPAKIAAEGTVPAVPKARYSYDPHLPPVLRFDPTGGADALPELLAEAKRRPLSDDEAHLLAEALRAHEPWLEWSGEKTYVVCNTGKDVACVDAKAGKVLWTAPSGGQSTAAVAGDTMVVFSPDKKVGLTAYKMTPEKAEVLWTKPEWQDGAGSPIIHNGYVYAIGKDLAACVELATGKVGWQQKIGGNGYTSPFLADGKLIVIIGKDLVMIEATPEKFTKLATAPKMRVSEWPSPCLVDRRLYLRLDKSIACYDLRPGATATAPAPAPAAKPQSQNRVNNDGVRTRSSGKRFLTPFPFGDSSGLTPHTAHFEISTSRSRRPLSRSRTVSRSWSV